MPIRPGTCEASRLRLAGLLISVRKLEPGCISNDTGTAPFSAMIEAIRGTDVTAAEATACHTPV